MTKWESRGEAVPGATKEHKGKKQNYNTMIKNYLKIAIRSILQNKLISAINIFGLTVGMACAFLIFLWVQNEKSYDKFLNNHETLYRVYREYDRPIKNRFSIITPTALGPELPKLYPEIIRSSRANFPRWIIGKGENELMEWAATVDTSFLTMFSINLISGDKETALNDVKNIIISDKLANKLFNNEDPLGKTIRIEDAWDAVITGVFKELPKQTHLRPFQCIVHYDNLKLMYNKDLESWNTANTRTYIQVNSENKNTPELTGKISGIIVKHYPNSDAYLRLQSVTDIHLYDLKGGGLIVYTRILSILAIFILLIAGFNYINISTARSALRSKEVGIRKVFGANRPKLIYQFLSESVLISFISLFLALAFVKMLVNPFNTVLNTELRLNYSILFVVALLVFGFITGLVSGIYPGFVLSSYKIVDVLKGTLKSRTGNYFFRRILIVFQFILTSIVIIGTIVVGQQLNFILSKDLGYVKDDIISIEITPGLWKNYKAIKSELLQHPGVINVTLTNSILERKKSSTAGHNVSWTGKENHTEINSLTQLGVDYDYLDVHKMTMVDGRYFARDFGTDAQEACVINESAVNEMGLTSPIGTEITFGDYKRKVIGVVKDFHFTSLHQPIEPLIMVIGWGLQYVCVKIESENQQATIDFIESKLKTFSPDEPFQYEFVESRIDQLYLPEKRTGFILKYGSVLSIILSSLGLFGLISFITKRRMKEICIRKVLGSPVSNVVALIMKEVLLNALFALTIAIPLSVYFTNDWLNGFAYKVDLSWWIFALTVIIIFALSLLTTGFQAVKAASSNPVKYLNYE